MSSDAAAGHGEPDAVWRRERASTMAFEALAEALVRDQRPRDQDFGLMAVAVLDAFRAGDRTQLELTRNHLEHLLHLTPEHEGWSTDFTGRLTGLLLAAELGGAVLAVESSVTRGISSS